ncbi:hypothetical protein GCM10009817_20890 [Terrabacter lapilli]|uniref:Uncharacterized protein n=1 Tax=Terrabacter lapilli TaxID=436231 RepID=A0ABN2S4Q5_9MICO
MDLDHVDAQTVTALCSSNEMVDRRDGRRPAEELVVEPEFVDLPVPDGTKEFDRIVAAANLEVGSPVSKGACVVDEDDQRSLRAKLGKQGWVHPQPLSVQGAPEPRPALAEPTDAGAAGSSLDGTGADRLPGDPSKVGDGRAS